MATGVRIEPVVMAHAEAVQRLAAHPDVVATTNLPSPYPADGAEAWVRSLSERDDGIEEHAYAIFSDADGLVGVTALMQTGDMEGNAELGYWIGRPFWGHGYATSANRLILCVGFGELALRRVFARPLTRNRASCRVLEKLGFRHVATQRNPFPRFDPRDTLALYELKHWQWRLWADGVDEAAR